MNNVTEIFGINVFNETVMKQRLPAEVYEAVRKTVDTMAPISAEVADVVAKAMKDWAIEKGATHYTHWFQPMTGYTAEKHDAFINPDSEGKAIMEFSGKALIKGESDASSFPSGGLRATFEARGYTAWDPTSYAFVKDDSLYIPTAFCSYSGEVLDKKTPLLRSMDAVNREALRVLKFFGKTPERVISSVGAEQEYFLVDAECYAKRKDLIVTGRTLFGAKPPKGQEMDDHYYGNIKERISAYMKEVDEELWKLGIYSKTKHNEAAPAQHELAPVYCTTNIATDNNQLMMEMLKKVAKRHGLVCLLHEKPFEGVNGSGKHNNWSIGTSDGENLLRPGKNPIENKQFLMFLSAAIKAVDEYGELLRMTSATAGNDHRLGANEAPPAIISMYIGDDLEAVLKAIRRNENSVEKIKAIIETGVESLPTFKKDTTDRNRTSPFAFTGNKFEFRSPGSSQSIAGINFTINAIIATELREFADRLEKADDVKAEIDNIIKDVAINHERIIFNGNNYSDEWIEEAARRGLPNLPSTVDALPAFIKEENYRAYTGLGIFTEKEIFSRYEILLEDYSKVINIEALTMLEMANREILPACMEYSNLLLDILTKKKALNLGISMEKEEKRFVKIANLTETLIEKIEVLEEKMDNIKSISDGYEQAKFCRDEIFVSMQELRTVADTLETMVGSKYWPFPTYTELLYNV